MGKMKAAADAAQDASPEFVMPGRAFMLKILEEVTNAGVASRYKNEKVAALAIRMEKWFTAPEGLTWLNFGGKDEPLSQEAIEKLLNWTPAILALPREHQPVEEIFNDQFDRLDEEDPMEHREPTAANAAE